MKKWKVGCLVVVVIILLILAFPSWKYIQYKRTVGLGKELIVAYLEQKYDRKFVINDAHYIWATKSYSFTVHPADDPELTFPAFISNIYQKSGMGDMYMLEYRGRVAEKLIYQYINIVSKDNIYGGMYGPSMHGSDPEWETIMSDIYKNHLTPLQAVSKYPKKIYFNVKAYYAIDISDKNKDEIFKKIFSLIEFLKSKKFGAIEFDIEFYSPKLFGDKTIKQVYDESKGGFGLRYSFSYILLLKSSTISNIKSYEDINKYFRKYKSYEGIINDSKMSNNSKDNGGTK